MSEKTAISWTDHTFNPWWGCIEVSPACDNCYARTFAKRTGHKVWGPAQESPRRFFADKHWDEPLKWNGAAELAGVRKRVFCASMADVFELNTELDVHRERLWKLIEATPWLEWLLLTKRPQNIQKMVPASWLVTPPDNVRYGTTVENQHYADLRVPTIIAVPHVLAPFLSMEPLLGPVNLLNDAKVGPGFIEAGNPTYWLTGRPHWGEVNPDTNGRPLQLGPRIGWVIVGGESGPHARPSHLDWLRSLRDQCLSADVAYHFKQWGEWLPYEEDAQPPFWNGQDGSTVDGHIFPDEMSWGEPVQGWLSSLDPFGVWRRVGNHKSGRLLDGREWSEYPAVPAVGAAS